MRGPRASIHPFHFHVQYPETGRTFREIRFQAGGAERQPDGGEDAPGLSGLDGLPRRNAAAGDRRFRVRFRRVEQQLDS